MVVPSVITIQTRSFGRRLSGGLGSWISLIKYSVHTLKPVRNIEIMVVPNKFCEGIHVVILVDVFFLAKPIRNI